MRSQCLLYQKHINIYILKFHAFIFHIGIVLSIIKFLTMSTVSLTTVVVVNSVCFPSY